MGQLEAQISATLPRGMHLPKPLKALFAWIEANGLHSDAADGKRFGRLFSKEAMLANWTDTERDGGTDITFYAHEAAYVEHWLGHDRPEVMARLCVFAQTGIEGSFAAIWRAPNGDHKIVHLSAWSGSSLCCVLADDSVDFLRLLAIGYDQLCWANFSTPPALDTSLQVHPNVPFRNWVQATYPGNIPETGIEIVKHPDDVGDENSKDPFNRWIAQSSDN